ncbi:polar amino acid transport system substrate-binding protein [Variovorax boronicumulans]|nr:transporter substrate-binding domain-containing protein [Variovorax boronicumulans]MDH6169989.1 polar amino acid transport system substrate-binding protein [Variovorax boronicumulans]
MSNSLLNKGCDSDGVWQGVAPDLSRQLAEALNVGIAFVPYATPSLVARGIDGDEWTVAMIAADPARRGAIDFTRPYAQIEAGYLVPPGSPVLHPEQVDAPGRSVIAYAGSAYGLWLERHLVHARLIPATSFEDAFKRFNAGEAEVLASLLPKLQEDCRSWTGCRILDGGFMTVQQAIGCRSDCNEALSYLDDFVRSALQQFRVEELIRKHGALGLRQVSH